MPRTEPEHESSVLTCSTCEKIMAKALMACQHCGATRKRTQAEQRQSLSVALGCLIPSVLLVTFLIHACSTLFSPSSRHHSPGSSRRFEIGGTYTTRVSPYGSPTPPVLDRVVDIIRRKDHAALQQLQISGRIIDIPVGTAVVVEEVILGGKAKVRLRGRADSLWIFSNWLS